MKGNSEEPDTLFRFCELSTSRLGENTFQSEGHTVYICQFECSEIHTLSHEHYHIIQGITMGHITVSLYDQQFRLQAYDFLYFNSIMMNTLKLFDPCSSF